MTAAPGFPPLRRGIRRPPQTTFTGLPVTTVAEWHARALDATGRLIAAIPADRWQASTPCPDWDVRGLVNHLVAGNLWAAELGSGATIDQVGDRLAGDLLGADPVAEYATSATSATEAFRLPGALERSCAVSYGPVTGSVYAGHRFIDVLIHGWDLATATGQDATLETDLVRACREVLEPQLAALLASGMFGQSLPVPAGASEQVRLLAALGRKG